MRRVAAVAAVLLVVLAGCSGGSGGAATPSPEAGTGSETTTIDAPATTSDAPATSPRGGTTTVGQTRTTAPPGAGTETATDAGEGVSVDVQNGDLAVDAEAILRRTTSVVDGDVATATVRVRDLSQAKSGQISRSPLPRAFGIQRFSLDASRPAGLTVSSGLVRFDPGDGDPPFVERRLAHEFVHVVQFRGWDVRSANGFSGVRPTTDWVQTWRSVVEGGAIYATDAYVRRHMPDAALQSSVMDADYLAGDPPGNRFTLGPYYFGYRYVASRVDSPAELRSVYESFPRTTEQVMHNQTPAAEPPLPLSTTVEAGGEWRALRQDTAGEMYLLAALGSELDRSRAGAAAAGWGNDTWQAFRSDDRWGLAWTLRWDAPAEADEFATAFATYRERRAPATDFEFRLVRVSPDTVVVFVGGPSFLDSATATGGDGAVTVRVGDG